ncbi:MAG: alpha-L-fucosidase [Limnochordia bacterium]|jgi:alpha-L-fucosidase
MAVPVPAPRIARFERLAFGLFLHFGLYSQLGKGEWIKYRAAMTPEEYEPLKDTFTAADFDTREIARLAKAAGMKYITLTTRHHDGFSLYDTCGLNDYDAPHSAAKRDLVAEFVEGCRSEGIVPFFYHTTLDWRWNTRACDEATFNEYLDYLHESVRILCQNYGPIGGFWFDGNWSRPQADWKEDLLYGIIRRYQPEAMIINNTGLSARGALGHPEIDSTTFEQALPGPVNREGWPKYVAGEMCQTLNRHWGIALDDLHYKSPAQVIEDLTRCRRVGANFLLNIGPTATGAIPEYEAALIRLVGRWIARHGDVIYNGKPTSYVCTGRDFILAANDKLYLFVYDLSIRGDANVTVAAGGSGPRVINGLKQPIKEIRWLDNGEPLTFTQNTDAGFAAINLTGYPYGTDWVVRVAEISI